MKKEKRIKPILTLFFLVVLPLGGLLSCGLEEYYYLDYIPRFDYTDTDAIISLPSSSDEGYAAYFDYFIIFYRIYISDQSIPTGMQLESDSGQRSVISSAFNSDFNGLWSLTDITSTSINTTNLENTFSNRNYFLLSLDDNGVNINNELDSDSLGKRLTIAFPTNDEPTLTIEGETARNLRRAVRNQVSGISFEALPDRRFLNHPDLYNTAITNRRNADIAAINPNDSGRGTPYYTYVSMYIAARGTSREMPPRTIYSQPTFIGIFQLSDR
jgi:hypothetical protein